jgi:hypothetical protein
VGLPSSARRASDDRGGRPRHPLRARLALHPGPTAVPSRPLALALPLDPVRPQLHLRGPVPSQTLTVVVALRLYSVDHAVAANLLRRRHMARSA